jgi:hypothetical protein
MREILEFSPDDLKPEVEAVLRSQGIPPGVDVPDKTIKLAGEAIELFTGLCEAVGLVDEISVSEFGAVYEGEGGNETVTPLEQIYPLADNLALFAVTVGEQVSREIEGLFEESDFALAAMLDTVASESTEIAGILSERRYLEFLVSEHKTFRENVILRYSPGYCGWHVSGQMKLFEYLRPDEIGITLTDSYLMQPLKSISGVMVVGRKEIHDFEMSYPFCENCRTKECRTRIRAIMKGQS